MTEQKYRNLLNQCNDRSAIIRQMRNDGLHLMDAVKLVRKLFVIDLGSAKLLVTSHEDWQEPAKKVLLSNDMIDELVEELSREP